MTARMSFPRIEQKMWPTTRPDKISGQHVNVTQLPFDIEVHPSTHLSLDYHILLHFAKPDTPFSQDIIMKKIVLHLQTMDITLGDQISKPAAILCHGPKTARVWSGMVKLHLKYLETDGLALLHGTRVFAIPLDDDILTVAKITKSYDALAPNSGWLVTTSPEQLSKLTLAALASWENFYDPQQQARTTPTAWMELRSRTKTP